MNDAVLVSREWLERANAALFGSKPGAGADVRAASLFYDVRPAVLASAWTQNAAGVYQATAQFIVNDAVDSSFTFPVVAPTATDDPGGDVGTTRFFVIWRGRWEMIAGAGKTGNISTTTGTALTGFTFSNNVVTFSSSSFVTSVSPENDQ